MQMSVHYRQLSSESDAFSSYFYWVGQKVGSVFSVQLSLTSFETLLLDCIVTAVLSVCIKIKIAILILKMGKDKEHIGHVMLYISRKVKTKPKGKKICAACGEGAVTDGHVKNDLHHFVLETSLWTMPNGRVDQLKLAVIELRP